MTKSKSIAEILQGWDRFERPEDGDKFLHYKGGQYEVVATGFLEDTEVPCVVYHSLEKDITWVRTAKNFFEKVEYKGQKVPRFKRI